MEKESTGHAVTVRNSGRFSLRATGKRAREQISVTLPYQVCNFRRPWRSARKSKPQRSTRVPARINCHETQELANQAKAKFTIEDITADETVTQLVGAGTTDSQMSMTIKKVTAKSGSRQAVGAFDDATLQALLNSAGANKGSE